MDDILKLVKERSDSRIGDVAEVPADEYTIFVSHNIDCTRQNMQESQYVAHCAQKRDVGEYYNL